MSGRISLRRDASLSHYDRHVHASAEAWAAEKRTSPVRVQWDPERSIDLRPLPYRAIQIGPSGEAVTRYAEEWICGITDVTGTAGEVRRLLTAGDRDAAGNALPEERRYPLPEALRARIGASDG
jgi:hypothetical protein